MIIEVIMLPMPKNTNVIFLAVLLIKFCVLMIDLARQLFFTEEKNAINKFIKTILDEYDYCKKVIKIHFNKNLVMSVEDKEALSLLKEIIK